MIDRRRWRALLCLAGLGFAVPVPVLAEPEKENLERSELALRMEAQGWSELSSGVFERRLGESKVEHLGYGVEGLAWTLGDLNRQLDRLLAEFDLFPTVELAETLEGLSAKISQIRGQLAELSRTSGGLTAAPMALEGASCDGVCYSATADAYHQTATQGVGAVAQAKFNNPCGYTGDTYAYAYARATQGTLTTQVTQEDPKTGSAIVSNAQAVVAGGSTTGLPCFSIASSYVQSSLLGFSYSTFDVNDGLCPSPPVVAPTCSVTGTTYEYFTLAGCRSRTWTATASGGATPYTYQWKLNGTVVGTGSSYTRSVCPASGDFTLTLTVTGANGQACVKTHPVTVIYEPEPMCGQYLC